MTRIIAGAARGRRLDVPPSGVRPTSDRAREGLFNSLATLADLDGARFLDLYAGSGAVGLEALSRGAVVTLVESDRIAVPVIERNLVSVSRDTARDGRPEPLLVRRPVELYLAGEPDRSYDVVFADPPYALGEEALRVVLDRLVEGEWLAADAVVVVERSARSAGPVWPDPLDSIKQKRYGEGMLWYGRRR